MSLDVDGGGTFTGTARGVFTANVDDPVAPITAQIASANKPVRISLSSSFGRSDILSRVKIHLACKGANLRPHDTGAWLPVNANLGERSPECGETPGAHRRRHEHRSLVRTADPNGPP